jgi:hypothetical protein
MTNVQSQSLVLYFIIATIAVIFLYRWYSRVSAKNKDVYVVGYNKMVRAFRSGNLEQVKKLKRESQLVESELYSAYKAGLKKAYSDCIDPNKSVKEL